MYNAHVLVELFKIDIKFMMLNTYERFRKHSIYNIKAHSNLPKPATINNSDDTQRPSMRHSCWCDMTVRRKYFDQSNSAIYVQTIILCIYNNGMH